MNDLPPVPEFDKASPAQQVRPISFGPSSDPIERSSSSQTLELDNKKLEILSFEHQAKVRIFYFALIAAALLFVVGSSIFCYMSHRMFGWQTILVLFAFFAPATIIVVAMIRAVYVSLTADKNSSNEELAVPNLTACKEILEIAKTLR